MEPRRGGEAGGDPDAARPADEKAKLREFLFTWLKVDTAPDMPKAPKRFPSFDAAVAADLRTSLDLFLGDVVWGDASNSGHCCSPTRCT